MVKTAPRNYSPRTLHYDSLAWVLLQDGAAQEGADTILEALKRVPQDPVIHEHLGDIYLSLGKKNKAAEAFQKALEFEHSEPDKIQEKLRLLK